MWSSDGYVLDAVLRMLGNLYSREGRREIAKGFLLLLTGALAMVAVFYLVYGRGPQCVVRVGKPRPHMPHMRHYRHWYWPFEDPKLSLRTSAEVEKEVPGCR